MHRVAILDHGKIVALDTPDALIRLLGAEERVVFTVEGSCRKISRKISQGRYSLTLKRNGCGSRNGSAQDTTGE